MNIGAQRCGAANPDDPRFVCFLRLDHNGRHHSAMDGEGLPSLDMDERAEFAEWLNSRLCAELDEAQSEVRRLQSEVNRLTATVQAITDALGVTA